MNPLMFYNKKEGYFDTEPDGELYLNINFLFLKSWQKSILSEVLTKGEFVFGPPQSYSLTLMGIGVGYAAKYTLYVLSLSGGLLRIEVYYDGVKLKDVTLSSEDHFLAEHFLMGLVAHETVSYKGDAK